MVDKDKITTEEIRKLVLNEENEFNVNSFCRKYKIDAYSNLRVVFSRFIAEGILARQKRGWYRRVEQVEPLPWWNGAHGERLQIAWPCSPDEDGGSFGFEDTVEVYPGDIIIISGQSNAGKTAFILNLLKDNCRRFEFTRLMINEYKPARFRDRMKQYPREMIWDDDKPLFDVLPVIRNHVDYIKADWFNLIDWLHISDKLWQITDLEQEMQMKLRKGILAIVLQKTSAYGRDTGVGGDWGKFLSAFYASIDPAGWGSGKLTVVKVKSAPEGAINPEGKIYGFDIIQRGAYFHNIREVKNCPKCKGSRFIFGSKCGTCYGKGYKDLEETPF